jgi:tRNA-2-methylthio-N6-dimethylallyladenosine synthase
MLLGQIVNAWKFGDADFADLLKEINKISGIRRLNFVSAHPRYMTDEVIEALKLPAHVNFLHLPAQSGSDKILQKMNRRYTAEEYLEVIKKVRAAKPDIALATDIIVGFPGETEKDFEDTVELYKKCDFDIAFLAKYSPRSGTPAFKALKDDVPKEEKERRWRVLQKLMEETVSRKNQKYLGQTVEVLIESYMDGLCSGNSREMKLTQFPGTADLVGKIVNVKIKEAKEWILKGELL